MRRRSGRDRSGRVFGPGTRTSTRGRRAIRWALAVSMLVACNPRGPGPNAVATPEGWGTPVFDSPTPSRTPGPYVSPTPTPTPTVDPCAAEIYEHEPREPFDLVGIVEVQRQNPGDRDSTLLESARDAACRLGGDAIVILYRSKRRHGGIPERPQAGVLPDVDLRGVVIRFRR